MTFERPIRALPPLELALPGGRSADGDQSSQRGSAALSAMAVDQDAEAGVVSAWPGSAHSAAGCWYSPREMAELGLDLRLCGVLNDVEYALLAFQADLHPDFATTVGALTGERPTPDRPRDYLALWQQRLAFERRRREPDYALIQHILRIVMVLRRLAAPVHPSP